MERISDLSALVARLVAEKTKEWDWKVGISIDLPEPHQEDYQVFLSMEKLAIKVVLLLNSELVETGDVLTIEEKIEGALNKLQHLAEERIKT